ncbi:nicotinate-nucleotide--dimethylbenzimidazole phosphoribosyltransferase [Schinkia azotoformans]|uniref:Nicotinate-nucleotide--dimethylbenzimidazole phosphoribosyltransferase n=1 Tax=Schinkia azotoformans LMG 9581 TaxID=1131731 RepID=K6DU19_SCHAZ|nr:nicotinate-nucleotide--dimethylbenzimidazole phosphoribosyltransferase [Schinkia azotoformans]EKN64296.1 nicotinate-nucleotide--dimethylbenzimidazole phosphoribosyltransferase [Schinkia azotoformans LMG 9581]MEC1637995.1 nicotinate-nucleotide--dimethylbenzimidazole phosphoribosyltransferase [Schinkia azotoformans]MEC1944892.1 nicotinate-nucleotide--dimethylbenzimidazole phosphoribosyltransferase [Schinkia azotoformans]
MTIETKYSNIPSIDAEMGKKVFNYIQTLTKPVGSLGRLEELAVQLGEITSNPFPTVTPPGILVFAADHGVAVEGVSAYPKEVTAQMVLNFLGGGAGINVFGRQIGAIQRVIDIGVASDIEEPGVIQKKVRYGTGNFLVEEAMTRNEVEQALEIGFSQCEEVIQEGAKCIILGELGIGNTTTSSAMLAALNGVDSVGDLIGRGTGISDEKLLLKQQVIEKALAERKPNPSDPIDVLSKVGGLEIAGMAGAMLAAAQNRVPILVDGFISTISALVAKAINPAAGDYMIVGHRSAEPGHLLALQLLEKQPLIDLGMRLGEGTGAAVAFPILQSATLMIKEMATFESAGVSSKE